MGQLSTGSFQDTLVGAGAFPAVDVLSFKNRSWEGILNENITVPTAPAVFALKVCHGVQHLSKLLPVVTTGRCWSFDSGRTLDGRKAVPGLSVASCDSAVYGKCSFVFSSPPRLPSLFVFAGNVLVVRHPQGCRYLQID